MRPGAPLRFLVALLLVWIAGRAGWLGWQWVLASGGDLLQRQMASAATAPAGPPAAYDQGPFTVSFLPEAPRPALCGLSGPALSQVGRSVAPEPAMPELVWNSHQPPPTAYGRSAPAAPYAEPYPSSYVATSSGSIAPAPPAAVWLDPQPRRSRLSVSSWAFLREGSGGAALASGGQLGASQSAIRLRWQLDDPDRSRNAIVVRLSSALQGDRQDEGAVGYEWKPLAGQQLWLTAERRQRLGGQGRSAWAAYASGGLWKPGLPLNLVADGYAQAGVVGLRRRDLFVDGALRLTRTLRADTGWRAGVGLWGGAQPGVYRVDAGPHLTMPVKVGPATANLAADVRIRVAGDAAPGSGAALTFSTEF